MWPFPLPPHRHVSATWVPSGTHTPVPSGTHTENTWFVKHVSHWGARAMFCTLVSVGGCTCTSIQNTLTIARIILLGVRSGKPLFTNQHWWGWSTVRVLFDRNHQYSSILTWSSLTSSDIILAKQTLVFPSISIDNNLIAIWDSDQVFTSYPC